MRNYNIPIFIPHEGCPHDCVFCNQRKITGSDTSFSKDEIIKTIDEHLTTLPKENCRIEAAFFGGSFTGISTQKQEEFLQVAYEYIKNGKIHGIRVSTRPDCISREIMDRLVKYGVTTVELGVQSMDEDVLKMSNRGHTSRQVEEATCVIRQYPISLGLQMMTGLPGDSYEKSVSTAEKIIALKPDFVRIYPTLVVRGTHLEKLYLDGKYQAQTVDEAVFLCKRLMTMFRENDIDIIRVSLVTTDEISLEGAVVAGPFHPSFRELCEGEIYFDKFSEILENEKVTEFLVNPAEISKAVGNCRRNVIRIKEKYGVNIKITPDQAVEKGHIKIGRNEF